MPNPEEKRVCPARGFQIFNPRYPHCESCGAALPESLLLSSAEREALARQAIASAESQIEDARRAREATAEFRAQTVAVATSEGSVIVAVAAVIAGSTDAKA